MNRWSRNRSWQKTLLHLASTIATGLFLLIGVASRAAEVQYEYDAAGRLRRVTHSDSSQKVYTLDAAGNRKEMQTILGGGILQLASSTASIAENGGTVTLSVTRTGPTNGAVSVSYATANSTAIAGTDYTATSGTLNWASGDGAAKTISVPILDDSVLEGSKVFSVALSNPTGGAVLGSVVNALVTINNDDTVLFSIASVSVAESAGTATFTVSKAGSTALTHAVNYATANGSATAGTDYTATSGTLTFGTSEGSKTFTVAISNDAVLEGTETFTVNLSAPTNGATLSVASATGTITEAPPGTLSFSSPTYSVAENGGSITITVNRTGGSYSAVSVNYATSQGTASSSTDYVTASGTLNWANGDASAKTFSVSIRDEAIGTQYEASETVNLTLSGAVGAPIGTGTATLTITDPDPLPVFSTGAPGPVIEGGTLQFSVLLAGSTALTHQVSYATASGTATSGSDFQAASGTLTFAPGETVKYINVTTIDDAVLDSAPEETMTVNMSNATNGATIQPTSVTGIIQDNESNIPTTPTVGINYINIWSYNLVWSTPSGPVSYYQIEEVIDWGLPPLVTNVNVGTNSKFYSNANEGQQNYRVRACNSSNQCSTFSNYVTASTCPPQGCP